MYKLTILYINSGRNDRTERIIFLENPTIDLIFVGEPHIDDGETEEREGYAKINTGKMVTGYAKTKILEDITTTEETEHTITIKFKNTNITAVYLPPGTTTIKRNQQKMIQEI